MSDFEYDPDRALWTPNRRSFFFGLGAVFAAAMLPDLPQAPALAAAKGWGDVSLKIGDTFTMSGVFAVNPITYAMNDLEVFRITAIDGPIIKLDRATRSEARTHLAKH